MTKFKGSTGSCPRACQKSPAKATLLSAWRTNFGCANLQITAVSSHQAAKVAGDVLLLCELTKEYDAGINSLRLLSHCLQNFTTHLQQALKLRVHVGQMKVCSGSSMLENRLDEDKVPWKMRGECRSFSQSSLRTFTVFALT